MALIFQIRL